MFSSLRGLATAVGTAAAVLAMSSPGYALPVFFSGSFAMVTFTSTTTDVDTTTSFVLSSPVLAGSPVGDFTAFGVPAVLMSPPALDFAAGPPPVGFDWSDVLVGAFTASSVAVLPSAAGVAAWNVLGTFVTGAGWDNAGEALTANMIWSATQTGGPDEAISLSGTFHSPAVRVPEPASLLLFGSALLAGGFALRRRQQASV